MQQIFSQKLRFKDDNGENYPDWEEKKLGEITKIIVDNRGKTPPTSNIGIPLIEINALNGTSIDYSKIIKFVDEETYNKWFRKHLEDKDILFSTVGQTAICSIYNSNIKSAIAQNLVGLRFSKNVNSIFMYYLLTETNNNNKFKRIEMGAVQPSVKVSQMIEIDFDLPYLEEQQKIASFLSAIDVQIEGVSKKIEQTKLFKKGLLQQMFV